MLCTRASRLVLSLVFAALSLLCASPAQEPSPVASQEARQPPAWVAKAVIYEIFPRDFSKEGTLNAVTARLDLLASEGINTLWIMPVHPIGVLHRLGPLGSPYAPRDYYAIDPALGTKEDFGRLVQQAHSRGMRVLLDMVADHTSPDSPLVTAHPDFYLHDAQGKLVQPQGWSDVAGLDYSNPALRQYMVDMFSYWLKTFQLDGFRCDAAAYVPTTFWEQLRPVLQQIRPDILLLAEASKPELMTHAFDLDYGWPMLHELNHVLEEGAPATGIETTWQEQQRLFPKGTEHMLISDDHDETRATMRFGERGALAAAALVFTLPGVPMLYNGMEVGDATPSGAPALFEKRTIDWQASQAGRAVPAFYHALLAFRAQSGALQHGKLTWAHNTGEQHVVSFERQSPDETVLVTANLSNTPFRGTVEVPADQAGFWAEVPLSPEERHRDSNGSANPPLALPFVSLEAFQVRIFHRPNAQPKGE